MSIQGVGYEPDNSLGGSFCPQQRGHSAWSSDRHSSSGHDRYHPDQRPLFFPIKILTSGVTRLGDDHAAAAAGQGRAGPAAAQQLLGTAAGVGVHHPFSAARHSWAIDLLDKG